MDLKSRIFFGVLALTSYVEKCVEEKLKLEGDYYIGNSGF